MYIIACCNLRPEVGFGYWIVYASAVYLWFIRCARGVGEKSYRPIFIHFISVMQMKVLNFKFRGEYYRVDEQGRINANGIGYFSDNWLFLGGTKHHWSRTITVPLAKVWDNPKLLEGCLGFDRDHGTTRQWGGQYHGRLPRITGVYISNL